MPQIDLSDKIKELNQDFTSKVPKFGAFKLSENGEAFLKTKVSEFEGKVSLDVLTSVARNAFEAAQNFLRPGFSDVDFAVARLTKYLKTGDAKFLTTEQVDIGDVEYSLAAINVVKYRLTEADFRESVE
jgi:hypothetical protein